MYSNEDDRYVIRIQKNFKKFLMWLAFAMTINNPWFSHGQLYVACSGVGKPSYLFVYKPVEKTKNIMYPTAL